MPCFHFAYTHVLNPKPLSRLCLDSILHPTLCPPPYCCVGYHRTVVSKHGAAPKDVWLGFVELNMEELVVKRHLEQWLDIDYNPYGLMLLTTGFGDGRITMRSVMSGTEVGLFHRHAGHVSAIEFCKVFDDTFMLSSSHDATALLWDMSFLGKKPEQKVGQPALRVDRKAFKKLGPLDMAISSLACLDIYRGLRICVGCHDSFSWMWTIDSSRMLDDSSWCPPSSPVFAMRRILLTACVHADAADGAHVRGLADGVHVRGWCARVVSARVRIWWCMC